MTTMLPQTSTVPDQASEKLRRWVEEWSEVLQPDSVHWCDGTEEEDAALKAELVENGTLKELNPRLRPGSHWAGSDPRDVARVESRTFICSESADDAGPTNNWAAPAAMRSELLERYQGAMRGRTMYVVPHVMGPLGSEISEVGVELTDSAYVVVSMRTMTRMGAQALVQLGEGEFVRGVHSVGQPLTEGEEDVPWPCDPSGVTVAHFPETREIWSYGSGYGGNALLGKKCFALRIASVIARDEGWLAEHMLVLKLTSPEGTVKHVAAAFPSACGKTNLAMLAPSLPGWEVETIGDDIAWMKVGPDGRLRAVNPEAGFFGVAPGTGAETNPNAMRAVEKDTIFTNTALTPEGDVWWEGMTREVPDGLTSWTGEAWDPSNGPAAHPNARFTTPATQLPTLAPSWDDPAGVPVDAILVGGRRSGTMPLVVESRSWAHGVFLGSTMASETTAAAEGPKRVRRDPFAMLPFCGYHMADHFTHWLEVGSQLGRRAPRIFAVNWFREDEDGSYLWPGFAENARVLAWVARRCDGEGDGTETPAGVVPTPEELGLEELGIGPLQAAALLRVDVQEWRDEAELIEEHYLTLERVPEALWKEHRDLQARLEGGEGPVSTP